MRKHFDFLYECLWRLILLIVGIGLSALFAIMGGAAVIAKYGIAGWLLAQGF